MSDCDSKGYGRHDRSPTTSRRALAGAVAIVALLAWGAPRASAARSEQPADSARLVTIGGGRKLFMECRGHGSPTVVLVTGLGERAENWSETTTPGDADNAVLPDVARSSRVCAYDRPGTAATGPSGPEPTRSTPVPQPTTPRGDATDLRALLQASGERGPFVLVGHSLGGPIIEMFASAYPKQVAGLVLVDALSEDLGDGLTPQQLADFQQLNAPATQGRPPGSEDVDYAVLTEQLRNAAPMPKVPTVVLSADQFQITPEAIASGQLPAFVTQEFADALWRSQLAAQDQLAAKFPGSKHVTKTNAAHYIQNEQPQLVVDSIRDVVRRARANR